jgi:hypothetical protein
MTMNKTTTTKTISKVCFSLTIGCLLTVGCATAGTTSPATAAASGPIGALVVRGPSVKAVVAGPNTIHVYSAYEGGAIYTAAAVAGTDTDCQASSGRPLSQPARLAADRVETVDVAAGQVACLQTASRGSFELLWHARKKPSQPVVVAHFGGE